MPSDSNISLIVSTFSLLLSYDVLKAGNTYLHLVHFDQTFHIYDLTLTHNILDLLIKFSYLNGIMILCYVVVTILCRVVTKSNDTLEQPAPLVAVLNKILWSHIQMYLVFIGLWTHWVSVRYTSQTHPQLIHRAILWMLVFLMSRVGVLVGEVIGYLLEFGGLRYPGYMLGISVSGVMLMEGVGWNVADTLLV